MKISQLALRARRRYTWNEIRVQATVVACIGIGGAICVLVMGTQLLDWRWLACTAVSSLAVGMYRTVRRLPSHYRVLQLVDHRLGLADSLSTAVFYSGIHTASPVSEPVREAQLAHAERLAEAVDLGRALPFHKPRAMYTMGALGLIATSLFALRYGIDRRLDLRPPLARILMPASLTLAAERPPSQNSPSQNKEKHSPKNPDPSRAAIAIRDGERQDAGQLDRAPESALDVVDTPDVNNSGANAAERSVQSKDKNGTPNPNIEQGQAETLDGLQSSTGSDRPSEVRQGGQPGKDQRGESPSQNQDGSSGENSSLLSKLRDAMSNLLSRMKQPPQAAGASQQQSAMAKQSHAGGGEGEKTGKTSGQKGGAQASPGQQGQQGEDSQDSQSANSKAAGRGAEQQASSQPGSGIGRQDGSKDLKLAEQLAAMGKISEIIGKRSASVTGDMTVEVESTQQQLRTPYAERNAKHGEGGGEISRDEIPIIFQSYVQKYFEEVRRTRRNTADPRP